MWHDAKGVVSEPRTIPRCFFIPFGRTVIILQIPPETQGPQASSMQARGSTIGEGGDTTISPPGR